MAESSTGIIEALFRPSTRYRDNRSPLPRSCRAEVELLPGLTIEDVLASGVTWEDFRRFVQRKIVWMTTHVFVCSQYMPGIVDRLVIRLGGLHDTWLRVHGVHGTTPAAATATCDFVVRLLATSEVRNVYIQGRHRAVPTPVSGAGLSLFFQTSPSCLRECNLQLMTLNEDQCLALATMSRLDVELNLNCCYLSDDASGAFVECLQSDRGPIQLFRCKINNQILSSALAGNSRVTKLRLDIYRTPTDDAGKGVLFRALANNRGLVDLDLRSQPIIGENWTVLCESLKAHSTLTSLDLRDTNPKLRTTRNELTEDQKAHRTRVLAEMMKVNTVLHTIELSDVERDEKIYTQEVLPHLQINLYRTRVLAISKADISLRRPLLGRALQNKFVRNDSNRLWMFLSGNADAVLQSDEDSDQVVEVPAASAPVEVAESAQSLVEATRKRKR
jgi:hypothetical protein